MGSTQHMPGTQCIDEVFSTVIIGAASNLVSYYAPSPYFEGLKYTKLLPTFVQAALTALCTPAPTILWV